MCHVNPRNRAWFTAQSLASLRPMCSNHEDLPRMDPKSQGVKWLFSTRKGRHYTPAGVVKPGSHISPSVVTLPLFPFMATECNITSFFQIFKINWYHFAIQICIPMVRYGTHKKCTPWIANNNQTGWWKRRDPDGYESNGWQTSGVIIRPNCPFPWCWPLLRISLRRPGTKGRNPKSFPVEGNGF